MSRCRALSLSDDQLAVIMSAATSLAPGDARSRFLAAVADLLTGTEVTNAAVEAAVERSIARFLTPVAS